MPTLRIWNRSKPILAWSNLFSIYSLAAQPIFVWMPENRWNRLPILDWSVQGGQPRYARLLYKSNSHYKNNALIIIFPWRLAVPWVNWTKENTLPEKINQLPSVHMGLLGKLRNVNKPNKTWMFVMLEYSIIIQNMTEGESDALSIITYQIY